MHACAAKNAGSEAKIGEANADLAARNHATSTISAPRRPSVVAFFRQSTDASRDDCERGRG
jgi:hypothetical protein